MGYRWRRFMNGVLLGRPTCVRPFCGEQRVGYSRFCRRHTDEIITPAPYEMHWVFEVNRARAEEIYQMVNGFLFDNVKEPYTAGLDRLALTTNPGGQEEKS